MRLGLIKQTIPSRLHLRAFHTSPPSMTTFDIAVTSDTVCPWCYVGRRNLQSAIQLWRSRHPDSKDTFNVSFLPFQLNPTHPRGPAGSISKQQFYEEKFGSRATISAMQERLSGIGREAGIDFAYGGRTGNSRDSHRLVWLASQQPNGEDAALRVVDGLFASYFENEGDITDYDTLRKVAKDAGISEDEFTKRIVNSDDGGREVDELSDKAVMRGVRGVPDFEFQGKYRLSGARAPEAIVEVLEKLAAGTGQVNGSGQVCN